MGELTDRSQSLRALFVRMVLITVLIVAALSLITILSCIAIRNFLVPPDDSIILTVRTVFSDGRTTEEKIGMRSNGEPNNILIPSDFEQYTEYTVDPVHSPIQLTPRRQLLYNALPVIMVGFPLLFAVSGTVACSLLFYKKKLREPITVLSECSGKISNDDLDFTITYSSADEMGQLCASFEKMRAALLESKQDLWNMMEERRQLNASVAHDLRTPIAIIKGYVEHLCRNIPKRKIDENKLMEILSNLTEAAERLERYVDSIKDIQSLDGLEISKEAVHLHPTIEEMSADIKVLADAAQKELLITNDLDNAEARLDKQVLYRILENTVSNSLRYAEKKIKIHFEMKENLLHIRISDDGIGFSPDDLKAACTPFYKKDSADGHMGLGLAICNILSKKHGGQLSISNASDGGAVVDIRISVIL